MPAPRQWRGDRLLPRTRGNFPCQQCCCPTLRSQLMLAKYATIVRRAGALTAVAAAITVAVSAALVGVKGLVGALIGVALVTVFFGISVLVVGRAARHSPQAMMVAAMITYVVKIVALAVVVSSLHGVNAFSARTLGFTAIALILETGWMVFSYLLAGMAAYGIIGWLIGRAVHIQLLFPLGMLLGLGISIGYIIHRFGRQQRIN